MSNVIHFSNLDVIVTEDASAVQYTFKGDIDEYFDHRKIPLISKKQIIFHLADIRNINSVGIREWVGLVTKLEDYGLITYRHCSIAVVDQFNLVPASIGKGRIESVYAPYFCEEHGEFNMLIQIDGKPITKAPSFDCAQCGAPLEFDSLEDTYFMFAGDGLHDARQSLARKRQ